MQHKMALQVGVEMREFGKGVLQKFSKPIASYLFRFAVRTYGEVMLTVFELIC